MTDLVRITRIGLFAHHGVLVEEARIGQRFYVSLEARLDTRPAARSDDIADAVSYAELTEVVLEIGTARRFRLIEALADAVARAVLDRFPRIDSIRVEVEKPSAPVPALIDSVAVVVERTR